MGLPLTERIVYRLTRMFVLPRAASFSNPLISRVPFVRSPKRRCSIQHMSRIRYARAQFRLFYFRSSSIYSALPGELVMSRNVIRRYLIERIDPLGGMDVSCELHYVEQSVSFRFPYRGFGKFPRLVTIGGAHTSIRRLRRLVDFLKTSAIRWKACVVCVRMREKERVRGREKKKEGEEGDFCDEKPPSASFRWVRKVGRCFARKTGRTVRECKRDIVYM